MTARRPGVRLGVLLGTGLLLLGQIGAAGAARAEPIRVAVASNFADCLEVLAADFADSTGHRVVLSRGSTGRHFAQIMSGAPFDVFFAADSLRPALLEKEGLAEPGTRFTYAEGRLALWLPGAGPRESRTAAAVLQEGAFDHLAIANPRLAPYGLAARQVLESLDLWDRLQPHLVTGQSVGQAWQFTASDNAAAGFVAYPQILAAPEMRGTWWLIDPPLHAPILQQAVVLKNAAHPAAARQLLAFVRGPRGRLTLEKFGYLIPEDR